MQEIKYLSQEEGFFDKIKTKPTCIRCSNDPNPWSDDYCKLCDEDPSDFQEQPKCPYCGIKLADSFHIYWCKKRRGII